MTVVHFWTELGSQTVAKAKSYQKCETVGKCGLQEAQMYDNYKLLHDPSKNGAAKSQIPMRHSLETMKFQRPLLEGSGEHI